MLVMLMTIIVFLQALWFGFVWDDNLLILENPLTGDLTNIPRFFSMDLWAATPTDHDAPYYRPIVLVDFTLDRVFFGLSPFVHHLHSLLWHLAAVWLSGGLLGRLIADERAVAAGMALFAIHPVQVESVVFISARNDPMAAAFMLGALLLLARDDLTSKHLLGGGMCMLAAALCKESVLLAPLLLAAVEWARTGRPGSARAHLAVGTGILAYGGMRVLARVELPPGADFDHLTAALLPVLAHYSERFLLPFDAIPGMHLAWPVPIPFGALGSGVVLCAGLVVFGRRKAAAGVVIAGLTLAPAIAAIAHSGAVPDRYLYFPLLGIGLALAAALGERLWGLGMGLGLLLAGLSIRALPVWQDDLTLWSAAWERWPSAYTAGSLAKVLDDLGRLDEAAVMYERATSPPRPLEESCYNITRIHFKRGDAASIKRAGEAARQAGCPDTPELLAPLAYAYFLLCEPAEARQIAERVGSDPTGMAVVVRVAEGLLRGDEAPLQQAIAANPNSDPAGLIAQARRLVLDVSDCSTDEPLPPPGGSQTPESPR